MERYFTIEKLMPCCGEASRCKYCHQATAEAHSEQPRIIANLNALVDHVLEPLHEAFKGDIKVLDGYRCAKLCRKLAEPIGPEGNQRPQGQAVTLTTGDPIDNMELAYLIQELGDWDMLLLEDADGPEGRPEYLYVSYRRAGKNRKEIWSREKGSDTYWQVSKLLLANENENDNQK
jgi:hypothetical protein